MNIIDDEYIVVKNIIKEKAIKTLFQPIVTVKSNKIMILEALSRGINNEENQLISPKELFNQATQLNQVKELDKICIENSLIEFNKIKDKLSNVLLSININMQSIIQNPMNNWFHLMVKAVGIDPKRIIIEILEDDKINLNTLSNFTSYNKQKGYLIAIDDIGNGYSGLMRMSILKPDIIKIDRSLITDINYKKHNQEIVRALIELGHRLGVLVTSEGIETVEDAMKLMEIGVDLQQGYYYSKPGDNIELISNKAFQKINNISHLYKKYLSERYKEINTLKNQRIKKLETLCKQLEKVNKNIIDVELIEIIKDDIQIEFVYVLDEKGVMITNTLSRNKENIMYTHYIFKPAKIGEDFSLKNYFIKLNSEDDIYISSPYISTATGIECVTVSKRFMTNDGFECILCVDLMSSNEICKLD